LQASKPLQAPFTAALDVQIGNLNKSFLYLEVQIGTLNKSFLYLEVQIGTLNKSFLYRIMSRVENW
jgi:hypothetical protein